MFYIIDLSDVPEDLIQVANMYIPRNRLKTGRYLHINNDPLNFFKAYAILVEDYELIDIKKLKELLLIKHLEG